MQFPFVIEGFNATNEANEFNDCNRGYRRMNYTQAGIELCLKDTREKF